MGRLPEAQKQHLLKGLQRAWTWNTLWLNRTELGSEAKTQDESMALGYVVNCGHSFIYLKNADQSLPHWLSAFHRLCFAPGYTKIHKIQRLVYVRGQASKQATAEDKARHDNGGVDLEGGHFFSRLCKCKVGTYLSLRVSASLLKLCSLEASLVSPGSRPG